MHAHAARSVGPIVRISMQFLDELTGGYPHHDFAIRLWDGTVMGNPDRRFTLALNHPGALRNMFVSPNELALGEAFICGDFEIEGDVEAAFQLADFLINHEYSKIEKVKLGALLMRLPTSEHQQSRTKAPGFKGALHSQERDRKAVRYHYDVSNEFYSLWLDRSMVYSCAYFKSRQVGLDTAQHEKLDYICKKLRLQRGERLLDLGCGWGGLMIHAAQNYGASVFGVTLSVPQAEFARDRFRNAGLADRCKVEVCDYRDLDLALPFDKVVSVGMFEHVGESLLPEYFRHAWDSLRPGGVFLNHGIAASATVRRKGPSFVDKYVFPDGELVPLNVTLRAAESAGFEVRDVENLREHYALTLRHWVRRLESKAEDAKQIVDDVTYRIWRLYMSGSAHAFTKGRLNLYQVLLSKPHHGESGFPLTRQDWYITPENDEATPRKGGTLQS